MQSLIFSGNCKVPTITLKNFSDCLHTSNGIFPSEETSWEISKGSVVTHCRRYFYLVSRAQASRGKALPVFLSFHSPVSLDSSSFPLLGPPQTRSRSKLAGRPPQERGLPLLRADGDAWRKAGSGKGIPRHAGGDGDDQGRYMTHAQSYCCDSRAGAQTHAP